MMRFTYEFKRMAWLLLMLVCAHGTTVAQNIGDTFVDGNLVYKVIDYGNEVAVVRITDNLWEGEIRIPEVSYSQEWGQSFKVTRIEDNAFSSCSNITAVSIPNSVTTIGRYAFSSCSGLKAINIPNSVTTIEGGAFSYCSGLNAINIPNSVTTIEGGAFSHCSGLNAIMVNADNANFSSSEGVLFDKSQQRLVQCPGGKKGEYNIPKSVKTIGYEAFGGCRELTAINIRNSVTTIEYGTFSGCSGLTAINIPNSVKTIGGYAFSSCKGLTEINIPNSVTSIGENAFDDCSGLTAFTVNADNANFSSSEGVLFDKSQQKLIQYPGGKKGEYNIPYSVKTIENYAFDNCSGLTNINIPNSVKTIGHYAFNNCSGLTNINIPDSVTTIGNSAFSGCSGLTAINIPNSVKTIGSYAFSSCSGLTNINIPDSVTTIEGGTFSGCSGLTAINIPNSVKTIGGYAFSSCKGLTEINIPNSVTTIGDNAFSYCSGLATLYFQSNFPPTASPTCFDGCDNIQTIYVPQEAVTIYQATVPYYKYTISAYKEPVHPVLGDEVRTWNTLYCQKIPATEWANHGVLKSAAQLKTNKQETSEGAIANLLDGDTQTFFHSTYNVPNTNMEAHYLQVDLGGELQHLLVKYAERNNPNNSEPRKVKVYATKDTLNGWTDLGTARFLNRTGTLRMDLGAPYRYLKLEIVETFSNMENNGNRFFTWSELGIWNGAALHPETCQQIPALLAQIEEAEALGQEPSAELTAQAMTLKAQLIKGDTCRFYDKAFHAIRTQAEANVARAEYVRNYEHTNWQALYLPFDIAFDDISDRFDVASLNDIHQYNDNENGQLDRTELKVQHLKAGSTLKANIPYMVRAKQTGEQTMAATNVTVQPMTSKQLDCSTIHYRYLFTGNYQEISGQDMFTKKYYAMSQGNLSLAANNTVYLSPFRWYMAAEDRTGNSAAYAPKMIRVVDIETGETTGIGEVETTEVPQSGNIYDLNGRLVRTDGNLQTLPKGIYILNGKKVVR